MADIELRESSPNSVVSGETLVAGGLGQMSGNEVRRALLRFDVATLPSQAVILGVQLRLQVVRTPMSPVDSVFELRPLLKPWHEAATSWNNQSATLPWEIPGAAGESDIGATASGTAQVGGQGEVLFASTPQLVAEVTAWLTNPTANHGWLLRSQSENVERTARHFASREALDADTRPRLIVNYVVPPVILNPLIEEGDLVFSFNAVADQIYHIETRSDFAPGFWGPVRSVGPFSTLQLVTERRPLMVEPGLQVFRITVE